MDDSANSLYALKKDLGQRFRYPLRSFTFYAQLGITVVGCGGAGIWYTIYTDGLRVQSLAAALLTYFPPLVAASTVDFIQEKQKPYLRMFGFSVGVALAGIFLFAVCHSPELKLSCGLIGTLCSLIFWWLANGEKDWVKDNPANAATGGNVQDPLLGEETDWKK